MAIGEILILIFMMFGVSIASSSYISGAKSLDDVSPFIDDLTAQIKAKNSDTLNSALANALGIPYFVGVTTLDEFIQSFKEKFLGELSNSASGVSVIADGTNTDTKKVSISSKLKNTAKLLSEQYALGNLQAFELQEKIETKGVITDVQSCFDVVNQALQLNNIAKWYYDDGQEWILLESDYNSFSVPINHYLVEIDAHVQIKRNSSSNYEDITALGFFYLASGAKLQNVSVVKNGNNIEIELYFLKSEIQSLKTYSNYGYLKRQLWVNLSDMDSKSLVYKYNSRGSSAVSSLSRREDGEFYVYSSGYILGGSTYDRGAQYRSRRVYNTIAYINSDFRPPYDTKVIDNINVNVLLKDSAISGTINKRAYIDKKAEEKLRAGIMDVVNVNSKVAVDGSLENTDEDTVAIVRANALREWRDKAEKKDEDLIGATFPLINTIGVDTATKVGVGNPNISIDQAVDEVTNPELPFIDKTPNLPQATYKVNNGLFTIYQPTTQNMIDLAYFLWSAEPIDTLKKLFTNPIDCIVSLALYPFTPSIGTAKNIFLGMIDTGISAPTITDIFQTISMGSVYVPEYYKNFLDYSPYTKVSIYLPFIGICQLNVDDVMGATLSVEYRCELISGSCLATIKIARGILNTVLYQFSGSMGMQVPVSGANFMQVYKSVIETIGATAGAIYSGGASVALLGNAVNNALSAKPEITRSGGMGGNSGFLGTMQPYLIIERPQTSIPNSFTSTNGIVSNVTTAIGSVVGYCKIMSANLSGIDCTQEEKTEIQELLENGIFV